MIFLSVIALLIAAASGWCLVGVLWPGVGGVFEQMARIVLAIALGLSLHSLAEFIRLLIAPGVPLGFFAVDLIVLAAALALWLRSRRKRERASLLPRPTPRASIFELIIIIAIFVIGGWMVLGVVGWLRVAPSGEWDAWAMWNFKASVIARGGEHWTHVLAPPSPHPDYPLHQPITIARGWYYCGGVAAIVPQAHAVLVASLVFVWLVCAVGAVRGAAAGCIAGALLASNDFFSQNAGSQYADVTVGLYMVLSIGLLYRAMMATDPIPREGGCESIAQSRAGAWLLAGLAIGAAAWTKHEGQFFAATTIVIVAITQWACVGRRRAMHHVGLLLVGALPGLVCAGLMHGLASWYEPSSMFHSGIASSESPQGWAGTVEQIFDPERHRVIRHSIIHLTDIAIDRILWVLVIGYALCVGLFPGGRGGQHFPAMLAISVLLLVMVGGYYGAYLLTTAPLGWHLQTSASRLAVQIWPCVVLAFTLALCRTRGGPNKVSDSE